MFTFENQNFPWTTFFSFCGKTNHVFLLISSCSYLTKIALDVKLIEFSVRQLFWILIDYFSHLGSLLGKILCNFFFFGTWVRRIHLEIGGRWFTVSLTLRQVKRTIAFSLIFSHHETTGKLKVNQADMRPITDYLLSQFVVVSLTYAVGLHSRTFALSWGRHDKDFHFPVTLFYFDATVQHKVFSPSSTTNEPSDNDN